MYLIKHLFPIHLFLFIVVHHQLRGHTHHIYFSLSDGRILFKRCPRLHHLSSVQQDLLKQGELPCSLPPATCEQE